MAFRTVIISSRAKLETRLNYLVIRGEKETKIFLNEIETLIVQSTAVSLTAALLKDLANNNVKVIFCDEKGNPSSELLPYYGAHNTARRYRQQFEWKEDTKQKIWQRIIQKKISEQAKHLYDLDYPTQAQLLESYACAVLPNDSSNREGHAAKVYFNCLFDGKGNRHSGGYFNGCLNYGYAILLSAFNREIVAAGYLTQLGIWHNNEFNSFNLACDLMEPLRITVDRIALGVDTEKQSFKKVLSAILARPAFFNGKQTTLDVAIGWYTRSVLNALEQNDPSSVTFIDKTVTENEL